MSSDRSWADVGTARRCGPSARSTAESSTPLRRRVVAVLGVTASAAVGMSGVAYAFWSASGTGSATVGSATAAPLVVSAAAAPITDLFPGRTVDLEFRVKNDNPYRVQLTTLTSASAVSSDRLACPDANISLAAAGPLATPIEVAPGATVTGTLPGMVTMVSGATDGCQGKTFTIDLALTGAQY